MQIFGIYGEISLGTTGIQTTGTTGLDLDQKSYLEV